MKSTLLYSFSCCFACEQDVALPVDADSVYEQACGSTIAAVLRRHHVYGDERYARLSQISISEAYLLDTLAQAMAQVPFVIHSFHSGNGSQYTNKRVKASPAYP